MEWNFLKAEWAYFTGALVTILFIVDPFALVPVYISLTERFSAADRKAIRIKASLISFVILAVFAISGMKFFTLFGITMPAFQIAGGLLLLLLGVSQLHSAKPHVNSEERREGLERDDISVFPLAMPLLAGPGAISTVVLYSTEAGSALRLAELLAAIAVCTVVCLLTLMGAPMLFRVLGRTGLNLMSRIMGMILTAIGVQFILNGIYAAIKLMNATPV